MHCRLREQSCFELITDEMIQIVLGMLLITLCLTWVSKTHRYHLIQYLCLTNQALRDSFISQKGLYEIHHCEGQTRLQDIVLGRTGSYS